MSRFKRYFTTEIGIEFKACLYFFAILFFHSVYQIIGGCYSVKIVIMAEMIFLTYTMGYIQVYLLRNFEETDKIGGYEVVASVGCSIVYTVVSYIFSWFDRSILVTGIYFIYMVICYFSMIGVYYAKRHIDTELLNADLAKFKDSIE